MSTTPHLDKPLFSAEEIRTRVHVLADAIARDYGADEILAVSILKGSFVFTADLIRALAAHQVHPLVDFMTLSSYGSSSMSSGKVLLHQELSLPVKGHRVLFLTRSRQGLQAVPVTRSYALSAGEPGWENIHERLAEALKNIAADLENAACRAIGHIKAVVKAAEGGYLLFSVTAAGKEPDIKGRLPGKTTQLQIVLNVIVYGINAGVVERIVDSRLGNTERMNMNLFQ